MFWKQNLLLGSSRDCQRRRLPMNNLLRCSSSKTEKSLNTFKRPPLLVALLRKATTRGINELFMALPSSSSFSFLSNSDWRAAVDKRREMSGYLWLFLTSFPWTKPDPPAFWYQKKDLSLAVALRVFQSDWRRGICYSRQHWLALLATHELFKKKPTTLLFEVCREMD